MGIFKRGKTWYILYYRNGQRVRRAIGTSKRAAEIALQELRKEDTAIAARFAPTLPQAADDWLRFVYTNRSRNTWLYHAQRVKALETHFKDVRLDRISTVALERYKAERLCTVSPATVNKDLHTLSLLCAWCVKQGMLAALPCEVHRLREAEQSVRWLTVDECNRLLTGSKYSPVLHHLVVMALYTGMRKSELVALRNEHIDITRGIITVLGKGAKVRHIPIGPRLLAHIQRVPLPVGLRRDSHDNSLRRVCRDVGIVPAVGFHALRHTFASHLVMAGVPLRTVQDLLGHARITTTMRYAHLSPEHLRDAIDTLRFD